MLIRRRMLLLTVGVTIVAVTSYGAYWYRTRPTHEVVTYFQVCTAWQFTVGTDNKLTDFQSPLDPSSRNSALLCTTMAILRSPVVLSAAIATPEVQRIVRDIDDPMNFLQHHLTTDIESDTVFSVKLVGRKSQMQDFKKLLDSVASCFMNCIGANKAQWQQDRLAIVEREIERQQEVLERCTKQMKQLREKANSEPATQREFAEMAVAKSVYRTLLAEKMKLQENASCPDKIICLSGPQGAIIRAYEGSKKQSPTKRWDPTRPIAHAVRILSPHDWRN